ncbi:MAG TPA: hypothetical protein ENL16_03370 [Candidatus Woesearchaeota archaeon]|nr:hypothetical protein [Candidatus Woesearchaeota archaeon]
MKLKETLDEKVFELLTKSSDEVTASLDKEIDKIRKKYGQNKEVYHLTAEEGKTLLPYMFYIVVSSLIKGVGSLFSEVYTSKDADD